MTDCSSKTLGSTIYSAQTGSGVPEEDRLGSRAQNPRSSDGSRRNSSTLTLWDGLSIECPSEQMAAFLLGVLLGEIHPLFPNSDRSHPSRTVILNAKSGGPYRSVAIRWDTWQYTYVPVLQDLFNSGRRWTRSERDLAIVEAYVRPTLE